VLWVWPSPGIAVVALLGSLALLVVRTREAWRGFRSFSGSLTTELATVTASADAVSAKAATLPDESARVDAALLRLQRSRARLAVLSAAIDDVTSTVSRVTGLVPRK
jgi:hypothetical protein